MYCTQCGSELKESSQFCSACGRRIPPGPQAVSEGAQRALRQVLQGPRRVKKHYPMRTAALVLGLVTAAILLVNGWGACAYGGDPPTPVAQEGFVMIRLVPVITSWPRGILDPTIVEAGNLAVATGALLLGAAALANIALRTSLALFGLALLGATWTVSVDYYSDWATRYFMAFPLIGACFIVMVVAWRKEKRPDSSVQDG